MQVRLHVGESGKALWVVNPTRETQRTSVELAPGHGPLDFGKPFWAGEGAEVRGKDVIVPQRDVLVVQLA